MEDVYIVGAGMIQFAKHPDKSVKALTMEAMNALLKDAPVKKDRIEAAFFSNSGWGMQADPIPEMGGLEIGQHCIRGEFVLLFSFQTAAQIVVSVGP